MQLTQIALLAALISSVSVSAVAEVKYLRCVEKTTAGYKTEHSVVLIGSTGQVDGMRYDIGSDAARIALTAPNLISYFLPDQPKMTLVDIDRVTGQYSISNGTEETERGHCVKVHRQF